MDKEEKREDSPNSTGFLNQLVATLEDASVKLEQAYKKDNAEQVSAIKQFILRIQNKIDEEIK